MRHSGLRQVFALALAGVLISSTAQGTATALQAPAQDSSQAQAAQRSRRVVTDEVGRRIEVPAEVRRIVSLAPNLTETVYALGLDGRLAGDTEFCDTPPAAKSKPHIGNPQNPSIEAIVALHPDLVLATTSINRLATADELKRLGIAVYTTDPKTVRGMLESIEHMADVMGAEQQGMDFAARMQERLDALHGRLADRPMVHVLFVVWDQPLITIGQNTFIADALRWAGAESIVLSKQSWPQLSLEEVVRLQPDYIVFADHTGTPTSELADLRARPAWRDLDAVQEGHVVDLSEEAIRPSPGLIDAIEQLARDVHPEAFSKNKGMPASERRDRLFAEAPRAAGAKECDECAR